VDDEAPLEARLLRNTSRGKNDVKMPHESEGIFVGFIQGEGYQLTRSSVHVSPCQVFWLPY
jgi:hypothetical protein